MSRRKITPQLLEDDEPIIRDTRNIRNRKIERLPKLDAQLGKIPDLHLARQYNLSLSHVRARRVALGIEPVSKGRPTGETKVKVSIMLREGTARWLEQKHPTAKTLASAAARSLDELAGSNAPAEPSRNEDARKTK